MPARWIRRREHVGSSSALVSLFGGAPHQESPFKTRGSCSATENGGTGPFSQGPFNIAVPPACCSANAPLQHREHQVNLLFNGLGRHQRAGSDPSFSTDPTPGSASQDGCAPPNSRATKAWVARPGVWSRAWRRWMAMDGGRSPFLNELTLVTKKGSI